MQSATHPNETIGIADRRNDLPVFIHSEVDDLPLTIDEFRVYGHLVRRAGQSGPAWPSLQNIGEKCFRASFPNAKPETLRDKAKKAISGLAGLGLLEKQERRHRCAASDTNLYHLSPREGWNWPAIEARRTAMQQGVDEEGGGGGQHPQWGATPPRGATPPKVLPLKFTPSEDTPTPNNGECEGLEVLGKVEKPLNGGRGDQQFASAEIPVSPIDETPEPDRSQDAQPVEPAFLNVLNLWELAFGEPTELNIKALRNDMKAHGPVLLQQAIGIALDHVRNGKQINRPVNYVRSILTRTFARGNFGPAAGAIDTAEARRNRYSLDTPEGRKAAYAPEHLAGIINRFGQVVEDTAGQRDPNAGYDHEWAMQYIANEQAQRQAEEVEQAEREAAKLAQRMERIRQADERRAAQHRTETAETTDPAGTPAPLPIAPVLDISQRKPFVGFVGGLGIGRDRQRHDLRRVLS